MDGKGACVRRGGRALPLDKYMRNSVKLKKQR